jgi:pyridoxamine 5'-phosphate oxidase
MNTNLLDEKKITEPFALFDDWLKAAEASEPNDPNAMALATVGTDGMPSVRMVLLKGHDQRGFVFYTNDTSRKGQQLAAHPKAALTFHWKSLRRQIRVEGLVEQATAAEADAYFSSRSRNSQLGAWASLQSAVLPQRSDFENRFTAAETQYKDQDVPRPPHWGGWRVRPLCIEFWQDMPFRLHDRLVFRRETLDAAWNSAKLYP